MQPNTPTAFVHTRTTHPTAKAAREAVLANPGFGGLEFNIPDSTVIRIPFPYDSAIKRYLTEVDNHKALYGE